MTDDPYQRVYIKSGESGIERYEGITDAIAISESTIRVELDSGQKAKKDGVLFGAEGGTHDVMVNNKVYEDVNFVSTFPPGKIKLRQEGDGNVRYAGNTIKRIQKV